MTHAYARRLVTGALALGIALTTSGCGGGAADEAAAGSGVAAPGQSVREWFTSGRVRDDWRRLRDAGEAESCATARSAISDVRLDLPTPDTEVTAALELILNRADEAAGKCDALDMSIQVARITGQSDEELRLLTEGITVVNSLNAAIQQGETLLKGAGVPL